MFSQKEQFAIKQFCVKQFDKWKSLPMDKRKDMPKNHYETNKVHEYRKKLKSLDPNSKQHSRITKKLNKEMKKIAKLESKINKELYTKYQDEEYEKIVVVILREADKLYKHIERTVKDNPDFINKPDSDKLDYFRTDYKQFMENYPIVARYMICMGQYSEKALRRFLDKVRATSQTTKHEKGYKEDQWLRRQADYVQYLWESYQKGHINTKERRLVWEDAYKSLRGEFDDFRDRYEQLKIETKKEKKKLRSEFAKDLLSRLSTGKQQLSVEETTRLVEQLKQKVYKSRFKKTLKQLMQTVEEVQPTCVGRGKNKNPTDPNNKIVMIEHVEEDKYDKYNPSLRTGVDAKNIDMYR